MRPSVKFKWLSGLSYQQIWDIQTSLHKELVAAKLQKRNLSSPGLKIFNQQHALLFCEHNHVFTLGKSGSISHLLLSDDELLYDQIEFFKINRGGDITYHGPGQITGYPIFDLEEFFTDVHRYVYSIEEAIILLLEKFGLQGIRIPGYTGVWLGPNENSLYYRKICAIGVHLSRWVSMHGFAFNVNTDLSYFDKIIPCGIHDGDKKVTSLSYEIGRQLKLDDVGKELAEIFSKVFDFEVIFD